MHSVPCCAHRPSSYPPTCRAHHLPTTRACAADFEKGFIRAETVAYEDFVAAGGFAVAKERGLLRLEGKEYVVAEGDILVFRSAN